MRISIILTHPNQKSFNHAIALTTIGTLQKNGYDVVFYHLY